MHLITPDEIHMRDVLEGRISTLMEDDINLLFSYLYRMDIPETEIKACLRSSNPVERLADIILRQQLYRMKSKIQIKVNPLRDNLDLKW